MSAKKEKLRPTKSKAKESDQEDEEEVEETPKPVKPERSKKKVKRDSDEDASISDDHEAPSQKKKKSQQDREEKAGGTPLSAEERQQLVRDAMRYFLFNEARKHPVRRADFIKDVIKEYKDRKNVTNDILKECKTRFEADMNLELYELPPVERGILSSQSSSQKNKPTVTGVYVLRSKTELALLHSLVPLPQDRKQELGLLMVILAVIKLHNNKIAEDVLFRFLERIGFDTNQKHAVFGDWRKLIEQFVAQRYLHKNKPAAVGTHAREQPAMEYFAGDRALAELDPVAVETFIEDTSGIVNNPVPVQRK